MCSETGTKGRGLKPESTIVIVVDHQERRSKVPEQLRTLGATVIEQHLDAGDYVLSERVGVERKTAFDFVTAIIQKRFYLQLEHLKKAYFRPLYIIEGRQLYGLRDVHPNFIRGALATLTVDYAIPTLFTHAADETAALLFLIARREQSGAGHMLTSDGTPAIRELQALPLVGRHRAEQLLNHFGTIEQLTVASEEELVRVPGIGVKTARKIKAVLGAALSKEGAQE